MGWITPRAERDLDYGRWLTLATERGGRGTLHQLWDQWRLSRGPGRLEADEYYAYQLYDASRRGRASSFVGRAAVADLLSNVVRSPWPALASDQLAVLALLRGFDLPVPAVRAVWAPGRHVGSAIALRSTEDAAAWLSAVDEPLFLKPVDARDGAHSLSIDGPTAGGLQLADSRVAPVAELARDLAPLGGGAGLQIQERLVPHASVAAICGSRIATVRLLWLMVDGTPMLHRAVWRIPVGLSPADDPWRPGNVLAGIDPTHGTITRATRGLGPDRRTVDTHADSGVRLAGHDVPGWSELVAVSRAATAAVAWCPIQAWDVAWTDRGAVLLELEGDGGDPILTQLPFDEGWRTGPWDAWEGALRARAAARDAAAGGWWSRLREGLSAVRQD